MKLPHIIAIVGPTASGKSAAALRVAKKLGGEIVSADSRQIYTGMDIGTAKTMPSEQDGIPHHLIDIRTPDIAYSVAEYQRDAFEAIDSILSRGRVPILCGGTGLYVSSVVENWDIATSGRNDPLYTTHLFGLEVPRETLYERINERVRTMMDLGFLDEVRALRSQYGCSAPGMNAIGYVQLCRHLEGDTSLKDAIADIQQESRRYAKRQLTWFRHMEHMTWVPDAESILASVSTCCAP